jgi:hypothetical protein
MESSSNRLWILFKRYKTLGIGLTFGGILVFSTSALADINQIRYSKEAASQAYSEEAWKTMPAQKQKPLQKLLEVILFDMKSMLTLLQEFAKENETADDYEMVTARS